MSRASKLRLRYLVTSVFTLALLALGAAAHAVEAGDGRRDPARFGSDALALHAAGWTVAEVAHEEAPGRGEGGVDAALTLVDPARAHALRLSLEFAAYGDAVVGYTRRDVPVPGERRVYEHEDALWTGLAQGAPPKLLEECGGVALGFAAGDFALGEDDWYVVERRAEGAPAAAALGDELRARLRAGARLADVHESAGGVAFVLVDDGADAAGAVVLEAHLDAGGGVVAVEVRTTPGAWTSGKLRTQSRLMRALRGRTVARVSLSMAESALRVRLEFTRGKGYVIDLGDLVYPEDEGCGC